MPGSRGGHRPEMQIVRQIGQMMFSYSTDNTANNNSYPDGNSSTEVFQKLLDGGYCSDPSIFYIPLSGKTPAKPGQKLKPENVCFDVTSGIASNASDGMPLIFMTGYKVTYAPGGSAVPIIKPYPPYGEPRTWSQWWPENPPPSPGIAVLYKGNNAVFRILDPTVNADGSISNFIPPDFDPKGKTYRQLTPDGPLPGK